LIQAKLKINKPGDKYEQEADQMADVVMRMPDTILGRQPIDEEGEEDRLQSKPVGEQITPLVQRQVEEEEEEEEIIQAKLANVLQVQRQEAELDEGDEVSLATRRNSLRSSGQPLDSATRTYMESRFGQDFSQVRVHTDTKAAESAKAVNALAYTIGRNVVFGAGQYTPQTISGKQLLGHELAHVMQQGASRTLALQRQQVAGAEEYGWFPGEASVPKPPAAEAMKPVGAKQVVPSALTREQKAVRFYTILSAAYIDLDSRASAWIDAAEKFGLCYYHAYKNHSDTIDAQTAHDKLVASIAFAIINVVGIGAISSLSTIAQAKGSEWTSLSEWKINAIEDMSQQVVGKVTDAMANRPPPKKITEDPLEFYLQLKSALSTHISNSKALLNEIVQRAKDVQLQPGKYAALDSFDPDKFDAKIQSWKAKVLLFRYPPPIPEKAFTEELEKGIWARWAALTLYVPPGPVKVGRGGALYQRGAYYKKPGGVIEKRLDFLGITKECGVGEWGIWTFESEAAKLYRWGKAWKPSRRFDI